MLAPHSRTKTPSFLYFINNCFYFFSEMSVWTHYTNQTTFDPDRAYTQERDLWYYRMVKPAGLWICAGDEWRDWADGNGFQRGTNLWRLRMDAPGTVRFIRSVAEMDAFCLEYGYIPRGMRYLRKRSPDDGGFRGLELCDDVAPVQPHHLLSVGPPPRSEHAGLVGADDVFKALADIIEWTQRESERTGHETPFHMRWDRIFDDYAGLVIAPYLPERSHIRWYQGWDVASGVVWDLKRAKITNA